MGKSACRSGLSGLMFLGVLDHRYVLESLTPEGVSYR
jgi:hypothetical protein